MPNEPRFTTITQHWHHFLERDIPRDAPPVQVNAMRMAFAAGAVSGLQLAITAADKSAITKHLDQILQLTRP